ncbi:MAG TPA: ABC transporter permease subunit, partial [Candidatus Acidoferrales bacterium]|nr:ABC transporter permease subunit [Candidatus Acidoferrales bacterium]
EMKVILAAVTVLFIVFFNTLAGVRNVDRDLVDAVWLMGAKPRDILFKVVIPSALSWALTGVRIAIPYALIGAIIGELIASNRGIGYLIASSASQYDTAGVFAALIVLTILAVLLNWIVDLIDARTSKWKVDAFANVRGV